MSSHDRHTRYKASRFRHQEKELMEFKQDPGVIDIASGGGLVHPLCSLNAVHWFPRREQAQQCPQKVLTNIPNADAALFFRKVPPPIFFWRYHFQDFPVHMRVQYIGMLRVFGGWTTCKRVYHCLLLKTWRFTMLGWRGTCHYRGKPCQVVKQNLSVFIRGPWCLVCTFSSSSVETCAYCAPWRRLRGCHASFYHPDHAMDRFLSSKKFWLHTDLEIPTNSFNICIFHFRKRILDFERSFFTAWSCWMRQNVLSMIGKHCGQDQKKYRYD